MGRRKGKNKGKRKRNKNQAPWIELPREVTANILLRLGPVEILNTAERVCSTWWSVCREPSLWRVFEMKDFNFLLHRYDHAGSVCRRAVDRSQGELIDIHINYFGTDDLLQYVSNRSMNLKILRIKDVQVIRIKSGSYNCLSSKGLINAVKNLHHLEELHIFFMTSISGFDIEEIGVSCPMLKSFTLHTCHPRLKSWLDKIWFGEVDNKRAISIAKSMPNLHRLRLFSCTLLTNKGLLPILDGCLNLEFLDLRLSFSVDLQQCDVGRRCSQIKEFRGPTAPWDVVEEYGDDFYF